jgi:CheY-like chemotaxis protein
VITSLKPFVLIVDNNHDTIDLWLEFGDHAHDVRVMVNSGGPAALQNLTRLKYKVDAIVTDLAMGEMSGVQFTRQVRLNEPVWGHASHIPIFWCTGYPMNDTLRDEQSELGVLDVFTKPITPQEIIDRVRIQLTRMCDRPPAD